LDFCIEWFDSNTKENSKFHLKIALENFGKKKKEFFSPSVLAWPVTSLFHRPALFSSAAQLHRAARLRFSPRPASLGRAQRRPSSRTRLRPSVSR
jgi:hypothetical protein